MDVVHGLVEPVLRFHEVARPAAKIRQAMQETLVHRLVDPQRVDPRHVRPGRLL